MSAVLVLILRFLLAAVLLGFVALVMFTLWQDVKSTSQLASVRQVPAMTISRLEQLDSSGSEFAKPDVLIGRDSNCDYSIINDTVSSNHARLSYHHNQWWIEDLASTNGTFLNDERVSTPTVIISNDLLRCGNVDLVVTIAALPG